MGKAPKTKFLEISEKIDKYKTKIAWRFDMSYPGVNEHQEIVGGELTAVFKRGDAKYTLNRTLGIPPTESQTRYRGPVRENLLTNEQLESMLSRAISALNATKPIVVNRPTSVHVQSTGNPEALSLFCTSGKFAPPEIQRTFEK